MTAPKVVSADVTPLASADTNPPCDKDTCWLSDRWWGHEGRWCTLSAACWLGSGWSA